MNPFRPVSVAATGTAAAKPLNTAPVKASGSLVTPLTTTSHVAPVPVNTAGRVPVQRIPDATQRLWIAPWVDTDDNFHQPAVVEFVKTNPTGMRATALSGRGVNEQPRHQQ